LPEKLTKLAERCDDQLSTFLDLARLLWYWCLMNRSVRIANCKNMTRFGWAVEGVAR
jgi:hypothetical protein